MIKRFPFLLLAVLCGGALQAQKPYVEMADR